MSTPDEDSQRPAETPANDQVSQPAKDGDGSDHSRRNFLIGAGFIGFYVLTRIPWAKMARESEERAKQERQRNENLQRAADDLQRQVEQWKKDRQEGKEDKSSKAFRILMGLEEPASKQPTASSAKDQEPSR